MSGFVAALLLTLPAPVAADTQRTVVLVQRAGDSLQVTTQSAESAADARRIMTQEKADPDTVSVELDSPVQALGDPVAQWGLDAIGAPVTWSRTTGESVVVAIVDTGVDASHEDLVGHVLPGRDLTTRVVASADTDPNGHGTHLAGIVGATAGNGLGGSGVAPGVTILPVRVLDATGAGFSSQVAAGIVWAADNGADIINLSLGGPVRSQAQAEAVAYAVSKGVLVVAAAGNDHPTDAAQYPAALPDVVAVGALTPSGEPASFSTRGDYVDLAAPGTLISSTVPGNQYAAYSGTSMAAPFVSGVAALLDALHPMAPADLTALLQSTAVDVADPGPDTATGAGLVSASAAVTALVGPLSAAASPASAAVLRPIRVATGTVRVHRGKRVVLRFPEVQGDSYTWSIRRPGTDWRVLHQDSATLRTPRLTRGLNGVRFKLVAQAAPPVYGIVRIRVLP